MADVQIAWGRVPPSLGGGGGGGGGGLHTKKFRKIYSSCSLLVSFRDKKKLKPHPDWSCSGL